jgi:hypothetical protein
MSILKTITMGLLLFPAAVSGQERWRQPSGELRPFAGVFVPVGAQRSNFKSATMVGIQGAVEVNRYVHGVASVGWTHGHNRFFVEDVTHIWQYDVGAELNAVSEMGWGWYFRPFVGAGAGGRTYDYRGVDANSTSCTAGYGSVGAEVQHNMVAFRAEARDYLSCFQSPITTLKRTRNDVGLTVGIAYHLR